MLIPNSSDLSLPPPFSLGNPNMFAKSVSPFLFCE